MPTLAINLRYQRKRRVNPVPLPNKTFLGNVVLSGVQSVPTASTSTGKWMLNTIGPQLRVVNLTV